MSFGALYVLFGTYKTQTQYSLQLNDLSYKTVHKKLTVRQCLKEILYISVNGADWFRFFLLWDELRHGQRSRFRFGERELLRLCGFDWSFLDLTTTRCFSSKLVHENIHLRAPPKGQICFHSLPLEKTLIFLCSTFLTLAEGQSSASPHRQHHKYYSTPLVSTWWGLWRRMSGTIQPNTVQTLIQRAQ